MTQKLAQGLEPWTSTLPRWRSTAELCQRRCLQTDGTTARTGSVGAVSISFASNVSIWRALQSSLTRGAYGNCRQHGHVNALLRRAAAIQFLGYLIAQQPAFHPADRQQIAEALEEPVPHAVFAFAMHARVVAH